jgi:hypothetical protein
MCHGYEPHLLEQVRVLAEVHPKSLGEVLGLFDEISENGPGMLREMQRQRRATPWITINRRTVFLLRPIRKPCVAFMSVNASLNFGSDDVYLHDIFVEAELMGFDSQIKAKLANTAP